MQDETRSYRGNNWAKVRVRKLRNEKILCVYIFNNSVSKKKVQHKATDDKSE